jgi:hypothetical protein
MDEVTGFIMSQNPVAQISVLGLPLSKQRLLAETTLAIDFQ